VGKKNMQKAKKMFGFCWLKVETSDGLAKSITKLRVL
jgi:hypothetical protein